MPGVGPTLSRFACPIRRRTPKPSFVSFRMGNQSSDPTDVAAVWQALLVDVAFAKNYNMMGMFEGPSFRNPVLDLT